MKRTSNLATGLSLAVLVLSGCKAEQAEPVTQSDTSDVPRSIFKEEPSQEDAIVPDAPLPPLRTVLSFADGTSELTQAVRAELMTIAGSPQVEEGGRIVLRGHSDSAGSNAENLKSSRERAEAVRDFLVEAGVDEDRVTIIAFGEQNPREPNALPDGTPNEAGRAANRRVHVTVETGVREAREQTLIETLSSDQPQGPPTATPAAASSPPAR